MSRNITLSNDDVSQILCARMCHDLVSPIGAVRNGLELLEMSGLANSPELSLLRDSIEEAANRIELFRLAFGDCNQDDMTSPTEGHRILVNGLSDQRLSAAWMAKNAIARTEAKLLILMALCVKSGLPYGGRLECKAAPLAVHATGTPRIDPEVWDYLRPSTSRNCPPRFLHFDLCARQALALGGRVEMKHGADHLHLAFVHPSPGVSGIS